MAKVISHSGYAEVKIIIKTTKQIKTIKFLPPKTERLQINIDVWKYEFWYFYISAKWCTGLRSRSRSRSRS